METSSENGATTRKATKAARPKLLLKILAALAGLWIIVLILLKIVLTPSVLDRLVNKYAAEYVDGNISVGKVSFSAFRYFPNVGVAIDDFSITYPAERYDSTETQGAQGHLAKMGTGPQADTLASFESFEIGVNLGALLRGKINIPYAQLSKPRIFIHRYHDGSANWDIFRFSSDTTSAEEEGSSFPELKLGRISLTKHPHVVYTDSRDTIFAMADLKQARLNGRLNTERNIRNRIGILIDSLFIAGRVSNDTLAFGLDHMGITERQRKMLMHAKAHTLIASRSLGRMHIPIDIRCGLDFPADNVPAVAISGLKANIASVPIEGDADIRMRSGRLSMDADLSIVECKVMDVLDGFLKNHIPIAADIRTDAIVTINAKCKGDYIYESGELPSIDLKVDVPDSKIRHKQIGKEVTFALNASAATADEGKITATLDKVNVRFDGFDLDMSGNIPDLMEEDFLINLDGKMNADLKSLESFLPDTSGINAAGRITAKLKGDIRPSHLNIYTFSNSGLEGNMTGSDIRITIPADTIDVNINSINVEVGPETKTSKIDPSRIFRLMAIKGDISKADIVYGKMGATGDKVTISAMNSSEHDTTKVNRLGGKLNADKLQLKDASGTEVELRKTSNGFQMLPKRGKPEIPVLTLTSVNDRISYKDGTNRIILTDAKVNATAAMNTVERRVRAKMFMDSLAKMYPEIPHDSLMRHMISQRNTQAVPEWLQEKDFKKKDINIKLDESLSKYFREWDVNGKLDIRTGILMTPYMPLRNILRGCYVEFDNDKVVIDSVKVWSGDSKIGAEGKLTGLRRALLGRGNLNLDMDIRSEKINANQLLAAYNAGSRYVKPHTTETTEETSDAEFFKQVTNDTLALKDTVTPLIVIPSNLNAAIRLDAGDITYSDLSINKLQSTLTMKERCVQISKTAATSNMGDISFEGFYATRSKKDIKAGFSFNFEDITAEKVINLIPAVDSIMPLLKSFNGMLDCELAATAQIDTSMNIIPSSINGIMRIAGEDMSIKDSEMYRSLAKKLMFKNKNEGYIKKMSVEGVISDSMLEIFPFVLTLDRYTLALSGIQNMDQSFRYHASLLKSPFLIRLGVDLYGENFDNMKFKIGKAKYKSTNVPVFSSVIDTTKINLVSSIRGIFEKGVEAAVAENERNEAIEKHKQEIGYVRAVDQELEALSKKEEEQIKAEEEVLKTQEKAEEALGEAIRQINLDLTSIQNTEKKTE